MKTNWFKLILFPSLLALASCSVAVESVQSRPPNLDNVGVSKLDTPEYGTFEVSEQVPPTFFMLPKGMNEAQVTERFRALGLVSIEIDRLVATAMSPDFPNLPDLFVQAGCPKLATTPDVQIDSTNIVWQKFDAADPRSTTVAQCQDYVVRSGALTQYSDALARFSDLIKDGSGLLDFLNVELKLLNPAEVGMKDVALKFQSNNLVYSTTPTGNELPIYGAAYIPGKRALVFAFAQLKEMKPTGLIYQVQLERSEDFLTLARFKGDANLVDAAGHVVQNGSFQLTGTITQ